MGLPVGEMESAYINLYRGDTTLQGLLTGASAPRWNVFDAGGVPTNQPFPYVVVQEIMGKIGTLLAMGNDAIDVIVQVNVFTQKGGFHDARIIAKEIHTLTQEKSQTLAGGFTHVGTLLDNYLELEEPDGLTQYIALRYKNWVSG